MPPKQQRITVQPASRRNGSPPSNYFTAAYQTIMSEDNRSVVISVAMFAVSHPYPFVFTEQFYRLHKRSLVLPVACASTPTLHLQLYRPPNPRMTTNCIYADCCHLLRFRLVRRPLARVLIQSFTSRAPTTPSQSKSNSGVGLTSSSLPTCTTYSQIRVATS